MENSLTSQTTATATHTTTETTGTPVKLALLSTMLTLAACGGGGSGGGTSGNSGVAGSSGESPAPTPASIGPAQASRFLGHAHLFATQSDINVVMNRGYSSWLDEQFNMPIAQKSWDWLYEKGYGQEGGFTPASDFLLWKDLLSAPDTLRKRVALILSEIFVVSTLGLGGSAKYLVASYWDLLNEYAFANFFDLLKAVTLSPTMGRYLNTAGNLKADPVTGRQPDENYAREVMQLFTIGLFELNLNGTLKRDASGEPIETYNQEDVSELAKVFTGWVVDNRITTPGDAELHRKPMRFVAINHSNASVSFLGSSIPANTPGQEALDMALRTLFIHPNVPPFWAKQLIQKMVTSNPSDAYVERVAKVFQDNGNGVRGDMKSVIRAVLLDAEAHDPNLITSPTFGKLREPMARYIQWSRTFNARAVNDEWRVGATSDAARQLGQSPFRSPSVFNFFRPNYVPPDIEFSSRGMVGPEFQLLNEVTVAGYVNFMTSTISNNGVVKADYSDWLELSNTPADLVNRLVLLFSANQIPQNIRQEMIGAVSSIRINVNRDQGLRNRLYAAILLIMASPQYLIQK